MGEYLIRASKSNDSPYLLWTTYSDSCMLVFADVIEARVYLNNEYLHHHPQRGASGFWAIPHFVEEVYGYAPGNFGTPQWYLGRCRQWGNSVSVACPAHWEGPGVLVMEGAPDRPAHGDWHLPRRSFRKYAEALLDGNADKANGFLEFEPWTDDADFTPDNEEQDEEGSTT